MKQDQGNYIAESKADFEGLEILYIEYWKEGVKKVWARKGNSFYVIFAKDEYTTELVETSTAS